MKRGFTHLLQHDWRNQAWLLKNSFGAFALKTRRARMPYKRFSPPRDTFLVTQFRQLRHFKGLFQQPQAIAQVPPERYTRPGNLRNGDVTTAARKSSLLATRRM
jgi:hypothetical protein